jgi:Toprim domain-containing protein/CHC2-type zinc finger protein
VVCEVPEGAGNDEDFIHLLTKLPEWAEGLPIAAKAWTGKRYAKTKAAPASHVDLAGEIPNTQERTQRESPKFANDSDGGPKSASAADAPTRMNGNEFATSTSMIEDEDDDDIVPLADLIGEPLVNGKIICPFHDDHNPSLVIYPDNYHCYVCGAHGSAIDWLMLIEGITRAQAIQHLTTWDGPRVVLAQDDLKKQENRARALRLWDEAVPITGTLAARYLAEIRGIDLAALPADVDQVLRFHRHCPFAGTYHPCLLALMRDVVTDEPTGIHRIGLTPEGRKIDRHMLGHAGAVKLWPAGSQLVVGEGIETVLAAATRVPYRLPLQPAWAVLSAGALERLPVLPSVERLIVLVDHDPAGKDAARICANRWQRTNRSVIRLTPKRAGADFNDLIAREAVSC